MCDLWDCNGSTDILLVLRGACNVSLLALIIVETAITFVLHL